MTTSQSSREVQQLLLLPRRELQAIAKSLGLRANGKSCELAELIIRARAHSNSQDESSFETDHTHQANLTASSVDSGAPLPMSTSVFDHVDDVPEMEENSVRILNVMDLFPKLKTQLHFGSSGAPLRVPVTPTRPAPRRVASPPRSTHRPVTAPRTPYQCAVERATSPTTHRPFTTPKTPHHFASERAASPTSALKQALVLERQRRRSAHGGGTTNETGDDPSWERIESHSKPGRFYWFNKITKETSWTR